LENKRAEQVPPGGDGGGGGTGEWEWGRWHKYCIHMQVSAKMVPVETVPGIGGEEMKESSRGGEFKYDVFDTLQELL
jgi:hypothetical protein